MGTLLTATVMVCTAISSGDMHGMKCEERPAGRHAGRVVAHAAPVPDNPAPLGYALLTTVCREGTDRCVETIRSVHSGDAECTAKWLDLLANERWDAIRCAAVYRPIQR